MPWNLNAVQASEGLIVAVGQGGKILLWAGGAYHPSEPASPTREDLRAVWLGDERNGWAVGDAGTVLHWVGGEWQAVALATRHHGLSAVWGANPRDVWIGGFKALFHYLPDGGERIATGCHILGIWGSGPSDVWFICAGRIGLHWDGDYMTFQRLPGLPGEEYRAIHGSSPADVWAVGLCGLCAHFDGERWIEVEHGSDVHFTGLCCAAPGEVWATTQSGRLMRWGGETWQTRASNPRGSLNAVCAASGAIWAVGAGGVAMRHLPGNDSNEPKGGR